MTEVLQTTEFVRWLSELRDRQAQFRVNVRIRRLAEGNPGDSKPVGSGVHELRIPHGPGYRVYYTWHGATVVLLLVGGDKATQQADIELAKTIAARERTGR